MSRRVYIHEFSSLSTAGDNEELLKALVGTKRPPLPVITDYAGSRIHFGKIDDNAILTEEAIREQFPLAGTNPALRWGRGNRIAATLAVKLSERVENLKKRYGSDRIALILGTSVAGMTETEAYFFEGKVDPRFRDTDLEMFNPVAALKTILGLTGPAYAISTACTSSTKAMIAAARLIKHGIVDAALCGGLDPLSLFTVAGFEALGATSANMTQPFGKHRDGINLGEGGAIFILDHEASDYELSGWGETSDAYHISSPDPEATSVKRAISAALEMGNRTSVDYVCAHGTGTLKNDEMEALAIHDLVPQAFVSSIKPVTGHTLGGAGALSSAACLLGMQKDTMPLHLIEDIPDPEIAKIKLLTDNVSEGHFESALCSSFAFGGNNAVILIERNADGNH